jgi:hypothetical protein
MRWLCVRLLGEGELALSAACAAGGKVPRRAYVRDQSHRAIRGARRIVFAEYTSTRSRASLRSGRASGRRWRAVLGAPGWAISSGFLTGRQPDRRSGPFLGPA